MCPRMQTQLFCPEGGCSGTWRHLPLRAVRFSVDSPMPYSYQACYCSICRKTTGGGGYTINLDGDSSSLRVEGEENMIAFQARVQNPEDEEASTSPATRHFCSLCGSALWLYDLR